MGGGHGDVFSTQSGPQVSPRLQFGKSLTWEVPPHPPLCQPESLRLPLLQERVLCSVTVQLPPQLQPLYWHQSAAPQTRQHCGLLLGQPAAA